MVIHNWVAGSVLGAKAGHFDDGHAAMRGNLTLGLGSRLANFQQRVGWLAPLAGGRTSAASMLLRMRRNPDGVEIVSQNGFRIAFRGTDAQVLKEIFVDQEYSFVAEYLRTTTAPRVLDVGGHIGAFAIWVFLNRREAQVLSLEADPDTFQVLTRNAEQLSIKAGSWQVRQGAAAARDGLKLTFSQAGPTMSHRIVQQDGIEVVGVGLESLIESVAPADQEVDLVKIDIEGGEEAFLVGGSAGLRRVRALVVELHPDLCDARRVEQLLAESFARVQRVPGRRSTKPILFCRRDAGGE